MANQTKPAAKTSSDDDAKAPKMAIRITCKAKGGIRRCGVRHPSQPVEYAEDAFSTAELKILKADPDLVVVDL